MITTTRKNEGAQGVKDSATWLSREQLLLTKTCSFSHFNSAYWTPALCSRYQRERRKQTQIPGLKLTV